MSRVNKSQNYHIIAEDINQQLNIFRKKIPKYQMNPQATVLFNFVIISMVVSLCIVFAMSQENGHSPRYFSVIKHIARFCCKEFPLHCSSGCYILLSFMRSYLSLN